MADLETGAGFRELLDWEQTLGFFFDNILILTGKKHE